MKLLASKPPPLKKLLRRAGKRWLAWKYRHFSPDEGATGYVKVAGLTLLLDRTVFDPRLHFTSRFFAEYLRRPAVVPDRGRVLDLGTGSGLLAISAALAGVGHVTAVDLNPAAVLSARLNVAQYGLGGKVQVAHGDMFEPVKGERFDLIICNPPYLKGEPTSQGTLAYMAGDDFRWLRRFARDAAEHLASGGRCLLVLADSTDLTAVLDIVRRGGWEARLMARRDLVVERLYIVELIVQSNES
ncbi:MAG TPA: methyltransferase [Chloroflexia bacterium]|jgi:release factor glutamine methyltransferase|nr:methyltransferase [Chloroflexia bacterium]